MRTSSRVRRLLGLVLPEPQAYGWWVVGACVLMGALSAPGQSYALALYLGPVAEALGAGPVEIASLYAWATLAAAAALPLVGRIADRSSSRLFLGGVLTLLAGALVLLSRVDAWWTAAVAFFWLRLLGQGAVGLGIATTVVRWFERHRARAMAVAVLGYALGEFVMPSVIVGLQEAFGWRASLAVLAALYLGVFAPLVSRVARAPAPGEVLALPARPSAPVVERTASEAVRMPRFWALAALVSVTPFVLTGLLINHVALFEDLGWSARDVALALQAFAVASLAATYGIGAALDRVPAKLGLLASMVLLGTALTAPLVLPTAPLGVLVYGGLLGAAAGATNAAHGILWPAYFGDGALGAIKGVVSTLRNGASAAAAPLAAWLSQGSGFEGVVWAGVGLATAGAAAALLLPEPQRANADPVGPDPRSDGCGERI